MEVGGRAGSMMRILHIITKGDVGGAQSHVVHLAEAQAARGHEVSVIAGTDGWALERLRRSNITTIVVPALRHAPHPVADLQALGSLRRHIRSIRPGIVHCHSSKAGLLGRVAARLTGVPAVYTAHGWPFQPAAPVMQRLASRAGETAAGWIGGEVICLTQAEFQLARSAHVCPGRRLHVIPLGLPDAAAPRADSSDDAAVRVIMVARFAPPKDQAGLVKALGRIADERWHLVLVGDGPERRQVQTLAEQVGVADRIDFLGARDGVNSLLASADIAVLWSRYEGMPLAVLEALRLGVPVVASDLPGVRAILGASNGGVVAATDEALSNELRRLIGSSGARAEMGAAGRRHFEEHFTLETMVDAIEGLYRSIIA
jgi:glycosyltransferase involved in cell wall biosynthesis